MRKPKKRCASNEQAEQRPKNEEIENYLTPNHDKMNENDIQTMNLRRACLKYYSTHPKQEEWNKAVEKEKARQ